MTKNFSNPRLLVILVVVLSVCCIRMSSGFGRGRIMKGMDQDGNYHVKYQREAKPYSNVKFDKQLGYVPRYRYPIGAYVGKRVNDASSEEYDGGSFDNILRSLQRFFSVRNNDVY